MEPTTNITSPHSRLVHSALAIIVVALMALSVILLVQYQGMKVKLEGTSTTQYTPEYTRALNFLDDLVNLVLGSDKEIGLDDRLRLENEVRALGDKDVLATWQAFTDAKSDVIAQQNVIKLFRLLVAKLKNK